LFRRYALSVFFGNAAELSAQAGLAAQIPHHTPPPQPGESNASTHGEVSPALPFQAAGG
jgi:hypothetical protein